MDDEFVPAESVTSDQHVTSSADPGTTQVSVHGRGDSGVKTVLIIIGCIVGGMMLLCGGAGVFAWYSIQGATAPVSKVVLHPSSETSSADFELAGEAFEQRIATGNGSAVSPDGDQAKIAAIKTWLKKSIDEAALTEDSIPSDDDLFHKAIMDSSLAEGMPFTSKLTIKLGIEASYWHPVMSSQSEVIGVDLDPGGVLAIAYVMDMNYDNNPDCYQIFLAKVGEEWRMYDWRDLDFGRRKSDEYANYFKKLNRPEADKYDDVLQNLADAYDQTDVYEGNTSKMLMALRSAEREKCLPEDRPEMMLNIAWYYRALSDDAKAKAILEPLVDTSVATGALASLSDVYFSEGNFSEAAVAANRLIKLIPNHPAAHFQLARALPELGRHAEAARHCLALLRLYPENQGHLAGEWYNKLDQAGIDEVVRLIVESGNGELIERDFASWHNSGWWSEELANRIQIALGKTRLAGHPVQLLVEGLYASAKLDYATAVGNFSKVMELGKTSSLKDKAKQLRQSVLIESDDFAKLFELESDSDQLVQELLEDYFNESYYFNMSKLAAVLETGVGNQLEKPFGKLLLAVAYNDGDDDRAIPLLVEFLDWTEQSPSNIADWEDSEWKLDSVNSQLANSYLRTHQCIKVLERWPDNTGIMLNLLDYCRGIRNPDQLDEIIRRASEMENVPVWMLHSLAVCEHLQQGNSPQALAKLELAIGSFGEDHDSSWVRDNLSRWLGRLVVSMRDLSILERESVGLNAEFFRSMAEAILECHDVTLAGSLVNKTSSERFGNAMPDEQDIMRLKALDPDDRRQLVQQARLARQLLLATSRDDSAWETMLDDAVGKSIVAGNMDELLSLGIEPLPGEGGVPIFSDVDLAAGRKFELNSTLSRLEQNKIAEWLGSDRVWQYQFMTGPLRDELIQKHGIQCRRMELLEEITIVQGDETPPDIASIASAIAEQFENAGPAIEYSPDLGKGWTIDIPDNGRIVISWRLGGIVSYESLTPEVRAATSDGKSVLMIGYHGQPASVFKKLFLSLPKIVNSQSLACFEPNSNTLWVHSDDSALAEQLKWNNRMPIETAVEWDKYFYPTVAVDFWESNERYDLDELKPSLQDASDGVPARLHIQVGFAGEVIPVKVLSCDESKYSLDVVVESPSKLRPELKKGTRMNAVGYDLLHVAD